MCKYNKLWCDGKAALLRKNQCDQCYRDAVLAMSQSVVNSATNNSLGGSSKEPGRELFNMLYEEYNKISPSKVNPNYWERMAEESRLGWAALEARVGLGDKVVTTGSSLAEQILALNYKEQHEIYKLLYAANHRI